MINQPFRPWMTERELKRFVEELYRGASREEIVEWRIKRKKQKAFIKTVLAPAAHAIAEHVNEMIFKAYREASHD